VQSEAILKPYDPQRSLWMGWRVLLVAALIITAAFYGLMAAVLPLRLITIPMVPILLVAALCLWLLPDIGGMHDRFYGRMLLWVLGLQALWPYYVAINLPGLPFIGPMRVVVGSMAAVFLFNLATSADMRARAIDSLKPVIWIARLYAVWVALMVITLPFSDQILQSITRLINNQIYWTMFLVLAAVAAQRPGWVRRAVTVMVAATIPLALLSLYEYSQSKVFWIEYVPDFLMARDELNERLLSSSARASTGELYRVRGVFTVTLYLVEYLAIVLPLAVHLAATARRPLHRLLLWAGVMAMISALMVTDSRSAMIAIVLTFGLYILFDAVQRRTDEPRSLIAMTTLLAYPVGAALTAAVILLWRRAYVAVIGGGQHGPSDLAREIQWDKGLDLLKSNPIGHGAGRSAEVVGYTNPAGELTIDSYYLSLLVDYGILGLPIFLVIFTTPIIHAWRAVRQPGLDPELRLLMPVGISIFIFAFLKSVLQGEWFMPIIFILLGISITLHGRIQAASSAASSGRALVPAGSTLRPAVG
jgi:hypothetical protein